MHYRYCQYQGDTGTDVESPQPELRQRRKPVEIELVTNILSGLIASVSQTAPGI